MKGIRFYADIRGTEYEPGAFGFRRGRLPCDLTRERLRVLADANVPINCLALFTDPEHRCHDGTQEALVTTFAHAGSDVSLGNVDHDYLRGCRHIDEATARKLHPRLAARLDQED